VESTTDAKLRSGHHIDAGRRQKYRDGQGLKYPENRRTFHRDNAKFISRALLARCVARNWEKPEMIIYADGY